MSGQAKNITGAIVWAAFVGLKVRSLEQEPWTHALLLFAVLVLVPLALDLLVERNEARGAARWFAWVRAAQLPAAVLLAIACALTPGIFAAVLALPWFGVTLLLAAIGVVRVVRHGWARPIGRLSGDAAMLFLAVGGAWALLDRAGLRPLGFEAAVVALTAVHFHYAGFLLPLSAGLVQRRMAESRFAARAVVGVVLSVPAVAIGILATQLGWGPSLEAAAGSALALAGMAVAILTVRVALDAPATRGTRALLALSGGALFLGMLLATVYAARAFVTVLPGFGIPSMRMLHGTINALGFGLAGLVGWRRLERERAS
jgi:hypothetical protein